MSGISSLPGFRSIDPQDLLGGVQDIKQEATKSLEKALQMMQSAIANGFLPKDGAPSLEKPKVSSAADITLRIGLLQDALNQLQQQVSKLEIQGRMNEAQENNKAQLEKMHKQMDEAKEAYKKNQEANKKSNIFEAVGNWFKAAFDVISAAFNIVAAIGYMFVNPVAAAGLFVAGAAMIASAACNIVLAIDATVRAAGGDGFLSDKVKKDLATASMVLGFVALGASLISGLAVIHKAVKECGKLAVTELGKRGMENGAKAASDAGKDAVKVAFNQLRTEMMGEAVKPAIAKSAEEAMKLSVQKALVPLARELIEEFVVMTARQAITVGVGQALLKIAGGAVQHVVADIRADAAAAQKEADLAAAAAKALEATIQMLRQMIEQLQEQLADMVESSMEAVSAIFNAADESQQTMKTLFQTQSA